MKKIWNIIYVLALVLVSACGGDDPIPSGGGTTNGGGTTPSETPIPTVTWSTVTATPDSYKEKLADMTYQILVYSFADSNGDGIGDFKGIQEKLDYIDALGVKAIWLSPIHPADSYHGYDVTDYSAVNSEYGTMNDFDNLVTAAHQKGIKVYLDFVLNHTGKGHPWFKDAKENEKSAYRNYYFFRETGGDNWYEANSSSSLTQGKLKFVLDSSKMTITVTQVSSVDNEEGDANYWIWYGDEKIKRFKKISDTISELSIDYDSNWGFLIRTSNTTWDGGTKYGAPSASSQITLGTAFTLDNKTASDIKFAGSKSTYYYGAFGSWMPDLNYGTSSSVTSNTTFKALAAAGEGWIKNHHIDGYRLDAVKHIYDGVSDNVNFLKSWYSTMNKAYQADGHTDAIYMVGEALDEHNNVAPYYAGLPAMFEFSFWYRLDWALNNNTGRYFAKDILSYQSEYSSKRTDYIEATKLSNHDEERTAYVLGGSVAKCKQAGAILLTAQGHPYIYAGEELALNPKKAKEGNGDEYVRGGLPWGNASEVKAVNKKSVSANTDNVSTQESNSTSILNVYRSFAKLRNTYPALACGSMSKHGTYNENNDAFNSLAAWYMTKDSQKILVMHNLSGSALEVPVSDSVDKAIGVLGTVEQNGSTYKLGANSSVVLLLK